MALIADQVIFAGRRSNRLFRRYFARLVEANRVFAVSARGSVFVNQPPVQGKLIYRP